MCKWGTLKQINVIRRNNPLIKDGWHKINVDSCIADEIQMLNDKGVITVGCCCGHFKGEGNCLLVPESKELVESLGYKTKPYQDELIAITVGLVRKDTQTKHEPKRVEESKE